MKKTKFEKNRFFTTLSLGNENLVVRKIILVGKTLGSKDYWSEKPWLLKSKVGKKYWSVETLVTLVNLVTLHRLISTAHSMCIEISSSLCVLVIFIAQPPLAKN